mmetsp:Transcript_37379/g.76322  ORF Transcript_37379/g.76322 Transcript_37379/m.76322 type:complete len:107 (-) Transcript_37379:253-573(-)
MGQQLMRRYRQWRTTREDRDDLAAMANELSDDVVAIIFGCLPPEDTMRMRGVCKKWREAAKKTLVPMTDFSVKTSIVQRLGGDGNGVTKFTAAVDQLGSRQSGQWT